MKPVIEINNFLNHNNFTKVGNFTLEPDFNVNIDNNYNPKVNRYSAVLLWIVVKEEMAEYFWSGETKRGSLSRIKTLKNGWNGGAAAGVRQNKYITDLILNGFAIHFYESRVNLQNLDELNDLPLNGRNVISKMEDMYRDFNLL